MWPLVASAVIPWGASFLVNKLVLREMGPANLAFWAWALAALVLGGYVAATGRQGQAVMTLRRQPAAFVALAAFLVTIPYLMQNYALLRTSVTNVSILLNSDPVFVVVLGALILGERVTGGQVFGIIAALAGTSLVTLNGGAVQLNSTGDVTGGLMGLVAALSLAAYTITAKVALRRSDPLTTAMLTASIGMVLLLPVAGLEGLSWPLSWSKAVWAGVLFLGLVCNAWGGLVWVRLLGVLDASRTAPLIFFIPLVSVTLSILLLGERPTLQTLFGAALIFGGIALGERSMWVRRARTATTR